jgi:1-acyl-sn-glycerol-3-phosphate acyltransferase
MIYGLLPRPVAFPVKAEVFRGPPGTLLRTGQIPVRRGTVETGPLRAALGVLAAGGIVGVLPRAPGARGRSSRSGTASRTWPYGPGRRSRRSPATAPGPRRGRSFLRFRRPPTVVAFGPPLHLPSGAASRRTVAAAADEIHRTLAAPVAATRPEPERDQP